MHSRETCEWKWNEKDFCKRKRKEKRNRQGKEPRTFDENNQVGDLSTLERSSQGEDSVPLKQTARERIQETSEIQSKGGEFKKSRRKRSGRRGRKRR